MSSPDLTIPEAARELVFACGCHDPKCSREGYLEEALPLVVAAELRGLAALVSVLDDAASFTEFLLGRVAELDPHTLSEAVEDLRHSAKLIYPQVSPESLRAVLAAYDARTEVLRWLVAMDDPEDPTGLEARRTVTLTEIIRRAREALEEASDG